MRLPIVLRYLVFFFPVLVVSFAVLMGGAAIARMAGDEVAVWVMNCAALAALLALVVDTVLLVGVLGIKSLMDADRQRNENQRRQRRKKMKQRMRMGGGPRRGGKGRRGPRGRGPRDE